MEALKTARRGTRFWGEAYIDHRLLTNLELRRHALVNATAMRLLCILLVLPRTHDGNDQKGYLRLRLESA
jgi:hypothetical protein